MTPAELLPAVADPDSLFDAFTAWVEGGGLELYPTPEARPPRHRFPARPVARPPDPRRPRRPPDWAITAEVDLVASDAAGVRGSGGWVRLGSERGLDKHAGRQVAQALNRGITYAVRNGLPIEDDPLGEAGVKPKTYRLPDQPEVNVRERGPRTLEQVPPARTGRRHAPSRPRDGLVG